MSFKIRQKGRKSPSDMSLIKLIKSPAIMASGNSSKILLCDLDELCDRIKYLLKKNMLEKVLTYLMRKLLPKLINYYNTNAYRRNNLNKL